MKIADTHVTLTQSSTSDLHKFVSNMRKKDMYNMALGWIVSTEQDKNLDHLIELYHVKASKSLQVS